MIEAGASVAGYRVERMIGRGGMGVVYEAVQTSPQRRVALKVLRPETRPAGTGLGRRGASRPLRGSPTSPAGRHGPAGSGKLSKPKNKKTR